MVLHGEGGCRLGVEGIDWVRARHPLPRPGHGPRGCEKPPLPSNVHRHRAPAWPLFSFRPLRRHTRKSFIYYITAHTHSPQNRTATDCPSHALRNTSNRIRNVLPNQNDWKSIFQRVQKYCTVCRNGVVRKCIKVYKKQRV